jgi:hypothetical protein
VIGVAVDRDALPTALTTAVDLTIRIHTQRGVTMGRAVRMFGSRLRPTSTSGKKAGTEKDISRPPTSATALLGQVDVWIYGHTESRDFMFGLTRTVSNSKGYGPWPPPETTWEKARFDPNFIP